MPVINLVHFEKLQVGNWNSVVGIMQSDAFGRVKNLTYLIDSERLSTDEEIQHQRPLFHTEFQIGDEDSGNLPSEDRREPVGTTPYKRVFYNMYDVKDTASKTRMEGRVGNIALWQLDANIHHDNYAPVLKSDPYGFTGLGQNLFMLARPTKESPLIKTTDLLFNRENMLKKSNGKVTTTEWCYQISSSTPDTYIPTYGYAPLSDLVYPSRYVSISSLYLRIGAKELASAITKYNAAMTVATVSSKIGAPDAADWQLKQLTAAFGEHWQDGLAAEFGLCCLSDFYYKGRHDNGASYVDYVRDMGGGDLGISVLQVNKYDFSRMDYNYIYWNIMEDPNQYSAGEMWFDLLYGKNSYTSRYSQQFASDGHPETASPGNFNRARSYSGIGMGGCVPFLTYYDDMTYRADGNKLSVTAEPSDFSTVETHAVKEGDEPRLNPLTHETDYSYDEVKTRGYPHIEQLREINVMINQSMHPSNLYKLELHQQYLSKLFTGIRKQKDGLTIAQELQTDIKNSIRNIAKKFAPATTELLTVKFP